MTTPSYHIPALQRGPHIVPNADRVREVDTLRNKYAIRIAVSGELGKINSYLTSQLTDRVDYEWQTWPDWGDESYIWFLHHTDATAFLLKFDGKIE